MCAVSLYDCCTQNQISGLMSYKRKQQPTDIPVADEADILKITPLGAGNEVGRSCIVLEYKGKTIMVS
jgi:cleavage and polyadenylation specificity factor subunit 3